MTIQLVMVVLDERSKAKTLGKKGDWPDEACLDVGLLTAAAYSNQRYPARLGHRSANAILAVLTTDTQGEGALPAMEGHNAMGRQEVCRQHRGVRRGEDLAGGRGSLDIGRWQPEATTRWCLGWIRSGPRSERPVFAFGRADRVSVPRSKASRTSTTYGRLSLSECCICVQRSAGCRPPAPVASGVCVGV
jgi:hypothetical protein